MRPEPVAPPASATYTVKPGDTLGRIALDYKSSSISLDQMLVALLRANPNAFIDNNMNLLVAGRSLSLPSEADARAVDPAEAHWIVIAESGDFKAHRSRIAEVKFEKAKAAAAAVKQTADEAEIRQRMLKEEAARAEAFKKTNEKLAEELKSSARQQRLLSSTPR